MKFFSMKLCESFVFSVLELFLTQRNTEFFTEF